MTNPRIAWGQSPRFSENLRLALLFGSVFLLFPLAHLRLFGLPVYVAETAVLGIGAFLLFHSGLPRFFTEAKQFFHEERVFILLSTFFVLGTILAALGQPSELGQWGKIKSFYLIPVCFGLLIPLFLRQSKQLRLVSWLWLAGLAAAALASLIASLHGWVLYDGRLAGLYASPNLLAMLLFPGALLAVFFSLPGEARRIRVAALFFLVLLLAVLVASRSYGAWAAVFAALGLFFTLTRAIFPLFGKKILFFLCSLALVLVASQYGSEKWQSLITWDERSSLASRVMIWQAGSLIVQESFPGGIGPGRFQAVYLASQPFFPPYLEWAVPTPHNLYLFFLLEGGMLTLGAFFALLLLLGRRCFRLWTEKRRISSEKYLFVTLFASFLVGTLVFGLVDTPYMKNDLALAFWGGLGLLLAALRLESPRA